VAPKVLAWLLRERWSVVAAPALALVQRVLGPVLTVLEKAVLEPLMRIMAPRPAPGRNVNVEELAALLDLSAKRGIIDHHASALLQEIVELTTIRVSDVMVPRVDVVAFDVDGDPDELAKLFARTRLRKAPVYEGDIDRIIGVVHAKRLLLRPGTPLRELVRPISFVPEAANLERVLLQLRVRRAQLAIVIDEYGGTAGLVTLEDLLEEIVGDIREPDEMDRGPAVEAISEREYLLDGDLAVHEWAEAFGIDLAGGRISTVGGLVTSLLGRIPHEGDEADYRNLHFRVESMRRRRIGKLRLTLREAPA
jgi:CBS domain containing-hemolysin-like protein